jgi:hypothetical protein
MKFYYQKRGDIHGPATLEELTKLFRRQELTIDTQVCVEGTEAWLRLGEYLPPSAVQKPLDLDPTPAPPKLGLEYKVVPFVAVVKQDQNAGAAAAQLQGLIDSYARGGWQYIRLESVETHIAGDAGCFGFGARPGSVTVCSMAVFKR